MEVCAFFKAATTGFFFLDSSFPSKALCKGKRSQEDAKRTRNDKKDDILTKTRVVQYTQSESDLGGWTRSDRLVSTRRSESTRFDPALQKSIRVTGSRFARDLENSERTSNIEGRKCRRIDLVRSTRVGLSILLGSIRVDRMDSIRRDFLPSLLTFGETDTGRVDTFAAQAHSQGVLKEK